MRLGKLDKIDAHTALVIFTVVYFLLIFVIGSNLFIQGRLELAPYLSAHALVFVNIVMGLLYIGYVAYWKGKVFLAYENTDWKEFAKYAAVGALLHVFLRFIQTGYLFSVEAIYTVLLGSAYAFVAITENAFFIGVIGDYFAERYNDIVGSLASGVAAVLYHLGVYGSSGMALLVVFTMFAYWAYASFKTRSTLYADLHHALGNYAGFVYSVVRVV